MVATALECAARAFEQLSLSEQLHNTGRALVRILLKQQNQRLLVLERGDELASTIPARQILVCNDD